MFYLQILFFNSTKCYLFFSPSDSCPFGMDVNTVNKSVQLSGGNRVATCSKQVQQRPVLMARVNFHFELYSFEQS